MKKYVSALGLLALPGFVFGQAASNFTVLDTFVANLGTLLNNLIPILVTLAVIFFFWGLALFIFSAGDETGREKGKSIMLWGIIALFIIVSIWGIIAVLQNIFGVDGTKTSIPVPKVGV